jgi:hypothetical protein
MKNKKNQVHTVYKKSDGTRVPGCTTIVGLLAKPQLISWANRLGLEGIDSAKYVDDLANVGTLAHEQILAYFTGKEVDTKEFSQNDIDRAKNSMKSFSSWLVGKKINPIWNEIQLVSEKFNFGGTLDMLAEINGKLTILDFKTGNAIYDEYAIQLGGYKILLKEQGYEPKKAMIVRVGRDNSEGFEVKEYNDEQMEVAEEIFMHLLAIYYLRKEKK